MGTFVSSRQVQMNINLLAPFQGAGDIVSTAALWAGLRAYNLATIGTNAVRLRRDSDNAEQDFATLPGTGALDVASITTFKGAANVFVAKLYDQSGNGRDLIQASAGLQPALILSGLGALPVMRFTASGERLPTASSLTRAQPYTFSWVAKRTSGFTTTMGVAGQNGGDRTGFLNSASTAFIFYGGGLKSATATDSAFHAVQGSANGAASDCNIDGVANVGTSGAGTFSATFEINCDGLFLGDAVEIGVWPVAFSAANSSAMSTNQHSYWGF